MNIIGSNTLEVCEAQMIAIVQEWLDRYTIGNSGEVTAVKKTTDICGTFAITIEERKAKEPA